MTDIKAPIGEYIKVEIDKRTAEMKVEAFGYTGGKCTTDIESLMQSMGARTVESTKKPEHVVNVNVQKLGR